MQKRDIQINSKAQRVNNAQMLHQHNAQCDDNVQRSALNAQCRLNSGNDGVAVENVGACIARPQGSGAGDSAQCCKTASTVGAVTNRPRETMQLQNDNELSTSQPVGADCVRPHETTQLQTQLPQPTNQPVGAGIDRPQGSCAGDLTPSTSHTPVGAVINRPQGSGAGNNKTATNPTKAKYFTTRRIAYLGIFTALTVVLYNWLSFSVPGFPAFLSFDLSNIPVLLTGFMLGPAAGVVVLIARFLLKMPLSSTMWVGEAADLALGLTFMLTACIIYKYHRTIKGAIVGLILGIIAMVGVAILLNRYVLVYFYVELFFNGSWNPLLGMLSTLYRRPVTQSTFFRYYLLFATIPFNLLTGLVTSSVTFAVYKSIRKVENYIMRS